MRVIYNDGKISVVFDALETTGRSDAFFNSFDNFIQIITERERCSCCGKNIIDVRIADERRFNGAFALRSFQPKRSSANQ